MFVKVLLTFFVCLGTLWAEQPQQDVEVLAKTVTKDGDVAHAVGNVVLYSPKYLITADEAFYNYVTGDLELFGNITLLEGVNYASRSGHTKLNLKTDKGTSDPLFFFSLVPLFPFSLFPLHPPLDFRLQISSMLFDNT